MNDRGSLYEAAGYRRVGGPGGWLRRAGHWVGTLFRYRGGVGQWAWVLHRATGLGIVLFLALHIVDVFLMALGPDVFNELLVIYSAPWARVLEVGLLFAVLFHAINGARVIVQDLWPATWPRQRAFIWVETAVFVPVFAWMAFVFLRPLFE